jgi:hypothetical protein
MNSKESLQVKINLSEVDGSKLDRQAQEGAGPTENEEMAMDSTNTSSRRGFLIKALGMLVVTAAAPTVMLGRVYPSNVTRSEGQVVATYDIKISDYPDLQVVGGSVKLVSEEQLVLNPDHIAHQDASLRADETSAKRRGWYPIAVTRVAATGTSAFKAISTYCTHGEGYQLNYVASSSPNTAGTFVCPHRSSTFAADGTHITKQNTPDVGDVKKFPATYDGGNTVTIQLATTVGVDDIDEIPEKPFLDQNYPNPFNPSTIIRYGLADASPVRLTVHTLLGNQVRVLLDQRQDAGVYYYDFSAVDLPSGIYFYRLQTPAGTLTRRMTVTK